MSECQVVALQLSPAEVGRAAEQPMVLYEIEISKNILMILPQGRHGETEPGSS